MNNSNGYLYSWMDCPRVPTEEELLRDIKLTNHRMQHKESEMRRALEMNAMYLRMEGNAQKERLKQYKTMLEERRSDYEAKMNWISEAIATLQEPEPKRRRIEDNPSEIEVTTATLGPPYLGEQMDVEYNIRSTEKHSV